MARRHLPRSFDRCTLAEKLEVAAHNVESARSVGIAEYLGGWEHQVIREALATLSTTPSQRLDAATVERLREEVGPLELDESELALRVPYDGDASDDGREIIVGGDVIATFEDSAKGEAARDLLRLALGHSLAEGR